MAQPIEVSEDCYLAVEEWLEDYYRTFPFNRIYEGGKILGHQGFMNNFDLEVEEVIQGVIEVRVVVRGTRELKKKQSFDKWLGLLDTPEKQGHLL